MKYLNDMMELTGKASLKKFLLVNGILFLWVLGTTYCWADNHGFFLIVLVNDDMTLMPTCFIFVIILYWMHHRRFKKVLQEGSYNRIRLLPIPKMTIVYSELLYTGATYTIMFLAAMLGWMSGIMLAGNTGWNEIFYWITANNFANSFMPLTWIALLRDIMLICTLSFVTVLLLLSKADHDMHITVWVVLVIYTILTKMINFFALTQSNGSMPFDYTQMLLLYIAEMLLLCVFSFYKLYKYFGRKERIS